MERALLDKNDIKPDDIVKDLTNYDNVVMDHNAVGYIDDDTPVLFTWYGNTMEIRNLFSSRLEKFQSELRNYFTEAMDGIFHFNIDFVDDRCIVQFFYPEEE